MGASVEITGNSGHFHWIMGFMSKGTHWFSLVLKYCMFILTDRKWPEKWSHSLTQTHTHTGYPVIPMCLLLLWRDWCVVKQQSDSEKLTFLLCFPLAFAQMVFSCSWPWWALTQRPTTGGKSSMPMEPLCYEKEKNMHRDLLYTLGLLPLNHQ